MTSYRHERESVGRIRSLRQDYSDRRKQEEVNEKLQEETLPAAVQQLAPINATYGDIMQLIGPTNYPAMLELFRGSNGLPGGVHPEVTVSFELFEAIQKRLVSTRDELDGTKRELLAKAQQLSTVQTDMARCNDRNSALSRDLKQAEDLCLELRKYSSDASILKQQHENEVIGFKDEIAGLVSRLNMSEKQVTEAHYKVSEALVQLAQKDAVIASLKRGARPSIVSSTFGESQEEAPSPARQRKSAVGIDRVFQDQLKQHISQVEKEKRSLEAELRDVLDMHEGYRHHVETVIRQYESQYMFYEDCLGSHVCYDEFAPRSLHVSADCGSTAETWETTARKPISNVQQLLELCEGGLVAIERICEPDESSTFRMQVSQCKDGAISLMRGSVESVRLLQKLDTHMSTAVSVGELRDTWRRVHTQWVDHIRRQLACGVSATSFGLDSVMENERGFRASVAQSVEDRWMRVISTQYKLLAPTRDSAVQASAQTSDATHQAGSGFFVNRVNVACSTQQRCVPENRASQTDRSGTPSSVGDLIALENGKEISTSKNEFQLDSSSGTVFHSSSTARNFCAMHNSCVQLAKLIRKLYSEGQGRKFPVVDPLLYLKQLDVNLTPTALDEVMELDTQLIKSLIGILTEGSDAEMRFEAYQRRAEILRLDKTVEAVGKVPPTRFVDESIRADVSGYHKTRARLAADDSSVGVFDEGSLQKKIRLLLQSDKTAVVMTAASREAVLRRHGPQSTSPTTGPSKKETRSTSDSFTLSSSSSSRLVPNTDDDAIRADFESENREAVMAAVNTAMSISVPSATPARRTPFRRTAEDLLVEQVRSTTPTTRLPTLSAKMEEALAFSSEGRRHNDGEPVWSSSSATGASRRSVSPARAVSPSMSMDGTQLSRRVESPSSLKQDGEVTARPLPHISTPDAASRVSLDQTPTPPPVASLTMTTAPVAPTSPKSPRRTVPKAPPRPILQTPARSAQGGFNVVDSSLFFVQDGASRGIEGQVAAIGSAPTTPRSNTKHTARQVTAAAPSFTSSRSSTPDSEDRLMPRTNTLAPSVIASQRPQPKTAQRAGDTSEMTRSTSADASAESKQVLRTPMPTKHGGKDTAELVNTPPRPVVVHRHATASTSAGKLTAAQIIENARQEQKRNMMGKGPLTLGPEVMLHNSGSVGTRPTDNVKVRGSTSPDAEVCSPPTTAPTGVARRVDALRSDRKPAGRRGSEALKALATIGVPVGASASLERAPPSPVLIHESTPTAANRSTKISPQRRVPTSPIEGIFGQDDERRTASPQHRPQPREVNDSTEQSAHRDACRPTAHPTTTHVPVGNPDTTVYRQRVHGLVPRRPTGTDVLNDILRKQRSDDAMDLSVTDFSINGTVARVSTVPSGQQRRASGRLGSVASPPEDVLNGSLGPFAGGDTPKAK